ncbi:uncharacterized protein Z520_12063 [Fonsecaea multimorphosa CBS 102226]|uniref:Fe2OG dioxygenase domain-containing protein n=1 Tax=Fonsecaea multimorphosa CBS 102226 TaxID=1442371 RepID=A0A0D2JG96_9EURO|nr:uncharacterized protein Z520_12063 [Fonsecaea multimorphosa CBS 102226]KIX92182.1 hypothetical protein Z520_12063 [Fonsecaea multimorphosa CBS 102226]OAL17559.1 hypothetical protein AYO22_11477 [Fonsecaea multimorphosa]
MVAKLDLTNLPPFPTDVRTAPIATISLAKILGRDPEETQKVLKACQTYGFFYLDLTDAPTGKTLLSESEELLNLSAEAFNLSDEEKQEFALQKGVSLYGYKSAGTVKATDPDRRPDSTEFLNIGKDHLFGFAESRAYPPVIEEQRPLLKHFSKGAHDLGMLILTTLARELGIDEKTFTERNIFTSTSQDHIRLTKKHPHPADKTAIGLPSHTDFGCVTILFNWLGGLQIQSYEPDRLGQWDYVKPVPGTAIINMGDAMVVFTNGALKSAKHRVVPAPGAQADFDRYSVVYFVRPSNDQPMKPVEGFENQTGTVKVAGKFNDFLGSDKIHLAEEWMAKRTAQMGTYGPGN